MPPAPRGLRLELHAVETHDTAPPRLPITAGGVVRRIQLKAGTGFPPPHEPSRVGSIWKRRE